MDRSPSPFLSRSVSLFGSAADGSQIQASHEMLAKSSGSSPLSPIRIKQEGTFYARLLSKENSLSATPSFRVYHGVGAASVPFVWESQPGTPKATFPASQLPPLTPPPSYFHHPRKTMAAKKKRKSSRSFSYLATLFRRLTLRKPCMPHPPMPKSPVSSVPSSPFSRLGSSDSRQKHSFSSRVPDDEDAAGGSILCFRLQRIPRLSMFRRRRDRQKNSVLERFG